MTPAERIVLLAAAASPLEGPPWRRADLPAGLPPQLVDGDAVGRLLGRGLLDLWQGQPGGREWIELSQGGRAEAGTLRGELDSGTRRLLQRIAEAGELVRRERPVTEAEHCEILAAGDGPAETVVEWVKPLRSAPPRVEGPGERHWVPDRICSAGQLAELQQLGLVVLLAGGTRALLTGAGRWCSEKVEVDHG